MKVGCRVDGIHFVQDFDLTFIPPCNFWGELGMSNLDINLKKKFWDWLFAMPSDEIALTSKINVSISIAAAPIDEENLFEKNIRGWDNLSEGERQLIERKHFKLFQKDPINAQKKLKEFDFTKLEKRSIIRKIKEKLSN